MMKQWIDPMVDEEKEAELVVQLDLLIQLYDGAIRFLQQAEREYTAGQEREFNLLLARSRMIIEELRNTLNIQHGGSLARQLNHLYGFMLDSLHQSELTHDVLYARNVVVSLMVLLEGWRGARPQVMMAA
ncbi:MAG: flagellar protein FliS [Magnetococcales bacterium]|nr:flagellar protein FliS [Magnetococcales bacterium]